MSEATGVSLHDRPPKQGSGLPRWSHRIATVTASRRRIASN